jgi:periplasmic copper chaperone A
MKGYPMRFFLLSLLAVVATAAEVTVSGAFARATAPSAVNGAVFFTMSGGADALLAATSPACERVELHTVVTLENGAKRMTPVPEIPVPGVLKPGSFHLMLMGLTKPLKEGEAVTLTLTFTTAPPQTITVPILGVDAMSAPAAEPACCAAAP